MKLLCAIFVAFSLLFGFQQVSAMTIKCALPINGAYQYKGATPVFFVTKNCTKQIFSGPTAFLQRFSSWKKIKTVSKTTINKIPKDKNYIIYPLDKNNSLGTTPTQSPQNSVSVAPCNNNGKTGGDGDYSVCIGNTIFHQPSGVLAAIVSVDNSKAVLSLSGLPGSSTMTLTVHNKSTGQVGGNNGYSVTYKYGGISSSTGAALITISSAPMSSSPTPTVVPTSTQIVTSTVPKKFLTLVVVNNGASGKYEDNGWERTIDKNSNATTQIFEVAMWDNYNPTNPKRISVYKFGSTFEPSKPEYINGGAAWVNYRESFNILNVDIGKSCKSAQGDDHFACSKLYSNALKQIMAFIVKNQPAEHYGIKYIGHGTNGGLFENMISEDDSPLLLSSINSMIGGKIDFLDWNTQCEYARFNEILYQYRYADYILASDLVRNPGTGVGGWPPPRLESSQILTSFFSPEKTIRQSLIDMIDNDRAMWTDSAFKSYILANNWKQSMSIFDTSKFENLASATNLYQHPQSGDILTYIKNNFQAQEQKFYNFRFHYASSKDFFPWDTDSNGFMF